MRIIICALLMLSLSARAELKTDIEFAKVGDVSLTLDVFVPEGKGPFPTAIIVHGGGFTKGDKQTFVKPLFEPFTKANFTWFTINYRLAPQYKYPAAVEDVERAIKWVKAHAADYKVDAERIALIGESAGGYLVAMAGVKSQPATRVRAVVPIYAPTDFAARAKAFDKVDAPVQSFLAVTNMDKASLQVMHDASPIMNIKRGLPPFLLIHGTKDAQVPYDQSVKFEAKMKAVGNSCKLLTIPDGEHGMGSWDKLNSSFRSDLVTWLQQAMK